MALPTRISAAYNSVWTGATDTTIASGTFNLSAGNAVLCLIGSIGGTILSVTDIVDNVYVAVGSSFTDASGYKQQFYLCRYADTAHATNVVTVTWTSSVTFRGIAAIQYDFGSDACLTDASVAGTSGAVGGIGRLVTSPAYATVATDEVAVIMPRWGLNTYAYPVDASGGTPTGVSSGNVYWAELFLTATRASATYTYQQSNTNSNFDGIAIITLKADSPPGTQPIRLTQEAIEVVDAGSGDIQLTQEAIEVVDAGSGDIQLTQEIVEVVYLSPPPLVRVTQDAVEVITQPPPAARVTNDVIELLAQAPPAAKITQHVIEVLAQTYPPQTVLGSFISATTALYGLTTILQDQDVVGGTIAVSTTLYGPTVFRDQFITTPIPITSGETLYKPTLGEGVDVLLDTIASGNVLYAPGPVIVPIGAATISATVLYDPTITLQNQEVVGGTIAATATFYGPTIATTGDQSITAGTITSTATLYGPTIAATGTQAITTGTIASTVTLTGPSVALGGTENIPAWFSLVGRSAAATGTTGFTITKPAETAEFDLVVFSCTHRSGAYITTPSGFTLADRSNNGVLWVEVFYKIAGGAEGASYSFTGLFSTACVGQITVYRNPDTSSPLVATHVQNNTPAMDGGLHYNDAFDTTDNDCLVVMALGAPTSGTHSVGGVGELIGTAPSPDPQVYERVRSGFIVTAGSVETGHQWFEVVKHLAGPVTQAFWFDSTRNTVSVMVGFRPKALVNVTARRYYMTTKLPWFNLYKELEGSWPGWPARAYRDGYRGLLHNTCMLDKRQCNGGKLFSQSATYFQLGNQEMMQYLTPPLQAQSLSGCTFTYAIPWGFFSGSGQFHLYVYVANGADSTVRHILLNDVDTGSGVDTTKVPRGPASPISIPDVDIEEGDYICIEMGIKYTGAAIGGPDTFGGSFNFGQCTNGNLPYHEGVVGDDGSTFSTSPSGGTGWFQFSQLLVEQEPNLGLVTNITCDTAEEITTFDGFPHDPVSVSYAQSNNREVYYKFTAPQDGRIILTTLGSNYPILIFVWPGDCDVEGEEFLDPDDWSTNQSNYRSWGSIAWDAAAGVQYIIRFSSLAGNEMTNSVWHSGGELIFRLFYRQAPESGDVFINNDFLIHMGPDGEWKDLLAEFGITPIGSAIDYTLEPYYSLETGLPHTNYRYMFMLYGGGGAFIEYMDLDTLSAYEAEVTYQSEPFTNSEGGASMHIVPETGNLYVGYIGDGWDNVIEASTAGGDSWYIERSHVNNVDFALGGGASSWPAATRYPVEQDPDGGGAWYLDVPDDESKIFYTSGGKQIKVWNITDNMQDPDFAELPEPTAGIRTGARMIKLLGDRTGADGMLVAYGDRVLRLDGSGTVIQTYMPADTERTGDFDKIDFADAARTEFWVSDQLDSSMWRFDIETGEELFDTHLAVNGTLCGFTVFMTEEPPVDEVPDCCQDDLSLWQDNFADPDLDTDYAGYQNLDVVEGVGVEATALNALLSKGVAPFSNAFSVEIHHKFDSEFFFDNQVLLEIHNAIDDNTEGSLIIRISQEAGDMTMTWYPAPFLDEESNGAFEHSTWQTIRVSGELSTYDEETESFNSDGWIQVAVDTIIVANVVGITLHAPNMQFNASRQGSWDQVRIVPGGLLSCLYIANGNWCDEVIEPFSCPAPCPAPGPSGSNEGPPPTEPFVDQDEITEGGSSTTCSFGGTVTVSADPPASESWCM